MLYVLLFPLRTMEVARHRRKELSVEKKSEEEKVIKILGFVISFFFFCENKISTALAKIFVPVIAFSLAPVHNVLY